MEGIPTTANEFAKQLRPLLEQTANAAGRAASPFFDETGKFGLDAEIPHAVPVFPVQVVGDVMPVPLEINGGVGEFGVDQLNHALLFNHPDFYRRLTLAKFTPGRDDSS
ncbi:MAG: hypothetical protein ACLQJR_01865 [Stellaceae bacterium]